MSINRPFDKLNQFLPYPLILALAEFGKEHSRILTCNFPFFYQSNESAFELFVCRELAFP